MGKGHHDALVKTVFADLEVARGTLRALLPKSLAQAIDFSTLEPVSPELPNRTNTRLADLLFVGKASFGEVQIALDLEHQSTAPRRMPFKALRYHVDYVGEWIPNNPGERNIPVFIPVVLYHGRRPWKKPRRYMELLGLPSELEPAFRPYLPDFELVLIDLASMDDEALREAAPPVAGLLTLLALKHLRYSEDVVATVMGWLGHMRKVAEAPNGRHALDAIFCYLANVDVSVRAVDVKATIEPMLDESSKEVHVTLREQWIEEGVEKGVKRGREEGQRQALQATLVNLLRLKFPATSDQELERAAQASVEVLSRRIERVLTATSVEDVLGA